MKVLYLPSTRRDVIWFRNYYVNVFQQGAQKAYMQLKMSEQMLRENPYIGKPKFGDTVRELNIARTPFSIIYRTSSDTVEILRIWDSRANPEDLGF